MAYIVPPMIKIAWTTLRPKLLAPGGLVVVSGESGLLAVGFLEEECGSAAVRKEVERLVSGISAAWSPAPAESPAFTFLDEARSELESYYEGNRFPFNVACDLQGRGGSFQEEVWEALRKIPYGEVRTYGDLASRIGRPGAARAVGGAVGRNPIPVIIPCHRVVGADGSLTGFSSGLGLKALLLEHEGVVLSAETTLARRRVLCTLG